MIYLSEGVIREIGINWASIIKEIERATFLIRENEISQPIKPYLRYKNLKNRIIAMPAFVGGSFDVAGIKWIASFPNNITLNIPRAHSITILNDANTGQPISILNSSMLSGIRTASVSGAIIQKYLNLFLGDKVNFGIIGFGPIGKLHFQMINDLFKSKISNIYLYDINEINYEFPNDISSKIIITNSWNEVLENSNILITCTVSKERYIDTTCNLSGLHLNVSLRDYKPDFYKKISHIIVDDWNEVCRENTDIEMFKNEFGLKESEVKTIVNVLCDNFFSKVKSDELIMFNPMGMAIFDIVVAHFFYKIAIKKNIGIFLEN